MVSALDEKLKETIGCELKRQSERYLVVNRKIDFDALIMVIADSAAGGP